MQIGICDDNAEARLALRAALERAFDRRRSEGVFLEFSSGEGMIRWMEKHAGELELVFLDLEMEDLGGMETARRLREMDEGLQLAFVTGYTDGVFDGYAVGALGYLMKPPKPEQLDGVLDRAAEALARDFDATFICRKGDTLYRIPKKSILYFASDRRRVTCVSTARTYAFYGKLGDVERAVGEGFVRIHQRYLVRAGAVDRVEGSQVFVGEEALPVSRACRSAALTALARTVLED